MTKTLLRVYDREDETALTGKCYFMVLDGSYEDLNGEDLFCILNSICRMSWQNYTSYAIATCDNIKEEELFWSEIMDYKMFETCISASRVTITAKYRLPEYITG